MEKFEWLSRLISGCTAPAFTTALVCSEEPEAMFVITHDDSNCKKKNFLLNTKNGPKNTRTCSSLLEADKNSINFTRQPQVIVSLIGGESPASEYKL